MRRSSIWVPCENGRFEGSTHSSPAEKAHSIICRGIPPPGLAGLPPWRLLGPPPNNWPVHGGSSIWFTSNSGIAFDATNEIGGRRIMGHVHEQSYDRWRATRP